MPSIDRGGVTLALARHGLAEEARRPALTLLQELRNLTLHSPRRDHREFAAAMNATTGNRIGEIVSGGHRSVETAALLAAARDVQALFVHSHPGSSAFSPSDAGILLTEACVAAIAAVGANGDVHFLSVEPGIAPPLVSRVEGLFAETAQQLAEIYQALPALGFTREQQWQEHSFDVWQRIAPALGLRYDRVRASRAR